MIECEFCEEFLDDEDVEECPNCEIALCERHLQDHVKQCGDRFEGDNEDY